MAKALARTGQPRPRARAHGVHGAKAANARAAIALAAMLAAIAPATSVGAEYLKTAPKDGAVPRGKVVYVDDGECPPGEIKEVTGGSLDRSIPRRTRCVKRPDEAKK